MYIAQLGASETNDGRLQILPADFADHDDGPKARSCRWMVVITTMMTMMVAVKMMMIVITMEVEREILEAYCFVTKSLQMSAIEYILKITDNDIRYSFAENCE